MTEDVAWVPEACTLPTAEQPLRCAEFDEVFAGVVSIERLSERHARFYLAARPGLGDEVSSLAARENECCSFFTFTVTPRPSGVVGFDVRVPAGQVGVLDALVARAGQQVAR